MKQRARDIFDDPAVRAEALDYIEQCGASWDRLARKYGISRTSFWRYRAENLDFHAACEQALTRWQDRQEVLLQSGERFAVDVAKWLLERRMPWEYSTNPEMRMIRMEPESPAEEAERNASVDLDQVTAELRVDDRIER